MSSQVYQANNDGSIELNVQSVKLLDHELLKMFETFFCKGSWQCNQVSKDAGLTIYHVVCGNITFDLYLYILNITSSSRNRPREQRIQLNHNISDKGFLTAHQPLNKCVILGVYRYKDETIFCSWHSEEKNNHGKQKSCYVDIKTIATAMRDGFAKRKDTVGSVVCAFKPEFIHFYLMHLEELHKETL